ncbi:MAG: PIG-L family deacetylase [Chloroflexia bacterium]|nr:PIG-L family deacetylase [Chloroflexia bacterium]
MSPTPHRATNGTLDEFAPELDLGADARPERLDPLGDPLLVIFAHPDDESFGCAGVMAIASERGVPITLISATRGEAGKTGIPELDTPEVLGAVREQELRAAAAAVGVGDVRFLDYRDSGMAGTPENDDPRSLHQAPEADVVAKLVPHLRAVRPATVISFGPDGIYGHPDHLAMHRAAVAAVHAAADPGYLPAVGEPWQIRALYFNATPRERLMLFAEMPDGPFRDLTPEQLRKIGTPRAEITTVIDTSQARDAKLRAITAHRTQVGEGGPLANRPPEQLEMMLTREHFVRVALPWDDASAPVDDLIATLAAVSPVDPA